MLNFAIAGINAAAMDLNIRIFTEKPALRSIYHRIFRLIQDLLTAPYLIE
jgi:hypothetical protein